MRHKVCFCVLLCTLCLAGCTTGTPRTLKVNGRTRVYTDKKVFGVVYNTVVEEAPTKAEATQDMLRKPAVWCLGISLPIALVAFACALVLQSPPLTKKCAVAAAIAIVVALSAAAWLLATMYLLLFAPLAVLVVVYGYVKMRGNGLRWHKEEQA